MKRGWLKRHLLSERASKRLRGAKYTYSRQILVDLSPIHIVVPLLPPIISQLQAKPFVTLRAVPSWLARELGAHGSGTFLSERWLVQTYVPVGSTTPDGGIFYQSSCFLVLAYRVHEILKYRNIGQRWPLETLLDSMHWNILPQTTQHEKPCM